MERDQFVAVETESWWLLERDVDYRIEDLRRDLGASFGWTDPGWYLQRERLEEVYTFILNQPREVLDQLDQATDDGRRQLWLHTVIQLNPPAVPSTAPSLPSPPRAATATPAGPRRPTFGSRAQAAPTGADARTETPTPATPSAPPPRRPAFGSRAQAAPTGADARTETSADADAPAVEGKATVDEQIQRAMSALPAEELSAMARELGLSPQEVEAMMQEPDFADLVAAEQGRLDPVNA
jgi:hypothetical protein